MNFAPLKNGVEAIKKSAERYQSRLPSGRLAESIYRPGRRSSKCRADSDSEDVSHRERPAGAPLFKHQVYAPGAYTGYGAKPIAAVREYMDQENGRKRSQVPIVGQVLENVAAAIGKAPMIWKRRRSRGGKFSQLAAKDPNFSSAGCGKRLFLTNYRSVIGDHKHVITDHRQRTALSRKICTGLRSLRITGGI